MFLSASLSHLKLSFAKINQEKQHAKSTEKKKAQYSNWYDLLSNAIYTSTITPPTQQTVDLFKLRSTERMCSFV